MEQWPNLDLEAARSSLLDLKIYLGDESGIDERSDDLPTFSFHISSLLPGGRFHGSVLEEEDFTTNWPDILGLTNSANTLTRSKYRPEEKRKGTVVMSQITR